jgi:hypothetical protein
MAGTQGVGPPGANGGGGAPFLSSHLLSVPRDSLLILHFTLCSHHRLISPSCRVRCFHPESAAWALVLPHPTSASPHTPHTCPPLGTQSLLSAAPGRRKAPPPATSCAVRVHSDSPLTRARAPRARPRPPPPPALGPPPLTLYPHPTPPSAAVCHIRGGVVCAFRARAFPLPSPHARASAGSGGPRLRPSSSSVRFLFSQLGPAHHPLPQWWSGPSAPVSVSCPFASSRGLTSSRVAASVPPPCQRMWP